MVVALVLGQYVKVVTKDVEAGSANRCMTWGLTLLAVVMMWAFWSCVYMSQMYPLIKPVLSAGEH